MAFLGLAVVAALLWGPLHTSYERACDVYPALRGVGPVPFALLTVVLLTSTTLGIGTLVAGVIRSLALSNHIRSKRVEVPRKLSKVISDLSLQGRAICIEEPHPQAFCYGLLRPMVCLSLPLVEELEPEELRAVLIHEGEHLSVRDPLRLLCGRTLTRTLFLMPLAEDLYQIFVLQRELRADAKCTAAGHRDMLASAMFKLFSAGTVAPTGSAGFNVTEQRVKHLMEPGLPVDYGFPWKTVFAHALVRTGVVLVALGILGVTAEATVVGCLL